MHQEKQRKAWSDYWSSPVEATATCLPGLPAEVNDLFHQKWRIFFDRLQNGGRLLDLGTGSGAVLKRAKAQRPDLHLTGIDYSEQAVNLGEGITLHSGIMMELLPFEDNSFSAVSSQFALEYGNTGQVAQEIIRVMADDGVYCFICHHAGGVIARDNSHRLSAGKALTIPTGLLDQAINAVRKGKKSAPQTKQRLARLFEATRARHAGQSIVDEVGRDMARMMAEPATLKNLVDLRHRVRQEGVRIEALLRAALSEEQAARLAALFPSSSLNVLSIPATDIPLAWIITNA